MDDLISRKAAIDTLCDFCNNVQSVCPHYPCKQHTAIDALPPVKPKKGKWIPGREIAREYNSYLYKGTKYLSNMPCNVTYENYKCSCCGLTIDRLLYDWKGEPFYKFCPNCGAEMEEDNG